VKSQRESKAELEESELRTKALSHKISRFNKDVSDAEAKVQSLEEEFHWIVAEKQFFGQPHTDFDFEARDPREVKASYDEQCKSMTNLGQKVNLKVASMMDTAEREYEELMHKRSIIEADKAKIEAVIGELEEKKMEAIRTTWAKVNADFGSIFTTLLPGTQAKLSPAAGTTVDEGLEVRVAFGGVWKESLTELSGGQRSLLALSLILAILLFKPAPLYILDEVDAALDLSHTQNIGHMIRTHFKHSQFLVVSLKQGMFSNANVIFRTKFVDGVSTVTRTVPAGSALRGAGGGGARDENEHASAVGGGKAAGRRRRGEGGARRALADAGSR
jgi:structural maintenance of chromosome 2